MWLGFRADCGYDLAWIVVTPLMILGLSVFLRTIAAAECGGDRELTQANIMGIASGVRVDWGLHILISRAAGPELGRIVV